MSGKSGVQRVTFDSVGEAEALGWNPSPLRLAVGRLPRNRVLQPWPWTESHNRPIAAECEHPACGLNALPRPSPLRPFRTDIWRPGFQRVIIGIRVQRLHACNHAQFSKTRNVD